MRRWPIVAALLVSLPLCRHCVADDWPQWRGPQRDGVWRETGVIDRFASESLTHKWSIPIGSGYSGPTVAAGRVYVTDRQVEPAQIERIHCVDELTGRMIWSHAYDCVYEGVGYEAGPRASVTMDQGRAFALGAMGDLHALDAATGEVLWHHRLKDRYAIEIPNWGITSAPLVYENLVILLLGGKPGACVVALEAATGEEVWRALDDRASYSAPILIRQANRDVLVVWTGDNIVGLDPATGRVYWKSPLAPKNMVIAVATPVFANDRLLVTSFYDGSKLLNIDRGELRVTEAWHRRGASEQQTDALHSIMSTPLMLGDYIYGVDSYGELRCLDARTGDRVWEDLSATPRNRWSNIHFVQNGDTTWMFNERGELIISRLSPQGFSELSRAKLIEPTTDQLDRRGQGVCWAHPAFANRHVFARNDRQLVCASLAAE